MASRALRLLRRPLYSSLCRSRALSSMPSSSSAVLGSQEGVSSWVVSQRETLHVLKAQSASLASSPRYFASAPGLLTSNLYILHSVCGLLRIVHNPCPYYQSVMGTKWTVNSW